MDGDLRDWYPAHLTLGAADRMLYGYPLPPATP
jgi:hypothetical protein